MTVSSVVIPVQARPAAGPLGFLLALRHGASAAWRAPSVVDASLSSLLAPADAARGRSHADDARLAAMLSHRVLGRLARLRPARWRSTCLYRSVAECLVLRRLGHPARVVIGVGADDGALGVMAHAWVECEGIDCLSTRGEAELERMAVRR